MEDRELRERLSRIEQKLGIESSGSLSDWKEEMQSSGSQQVIQDRIGQLLVQIHERKQASRDPGFTSYLETMENNLIRERMKLEDMAENLEKNYEIYQRKQSLLQPQPAEPSELTPQPEPTSPSDSELQPEPIIQSQPGWQTQAAQPAPRPLSRPKTDMEFKFGAVVLSIIGALFIIAAFITFGLNFMDSLAQGVLLYVLAVVIIIPSEVLLRKNLPKFAQAVTGIGICILYTATILNYLYLHTIDAVVAVIITVAVSVFALLLSRKRDSATLRLIGILGCYISLMPLDRFESQMNFVIPCVILVIVNALYILLPLEKKNVAVPVVHSLANLAVTVFLVTTAWYSDLPALPSFVFVLVMLVSIYAIYYRMELEITALVFFAFVHMAMTLVLAFTISETKFLIPGTIAFALVLAAAFCFYRKKAGRWMGLYCLTGFVLVAFAGQSAFWYLLAISVMLAVYKILSFREELKYGDVMVSLIAAAVFLDYAQNSSNMQYVLLGVFVVSVVTLKHYKTLHELVLLGILEGFAVICFDDFISLPLALAFLFLCLFLFGQIDRYIGKNFKVFVIATVVVDGIILLATPFLDNAVSLSLILVLELAYILLICSKNYCPVAEKASKFRPFAISIFLTYMIFVYEIDIPIVTSILLMLLAIASVGAGFLLRQKNVRIYGLVLSLFVCAKIMLVDFSDTQSADKVILFFIVGILALAISYLYMRIERTLERSLERSEEKPL